MSLFLGCYWTLYFILTNPDARRAVEEELRSVLGDRAPSADLRIDAVDLPNMVVLDSCISEALRLMSGSMIMRQVVPKEGGTLTLNSGKSYRFRQGDKVGIFPSLTHFNEDFFPDASGEWLYQA
jgi:cytochrome P450